MLTRIGRFAALLLSISALPSISAQDQTRVDRDRFSIITHDGGTIILRSSDGPYKNTEEFPAAVRAALRSVPTTTSSDLVAAKTTTAFVVSDPSDAADSDINDVTYDPPTLRSAIQNANKLGGSHSITFSSGLTIIQPSASLPSITAALQIDGSVSAGKIVLDGTSVSNGIGLLIGSNSTIQNISFQHWSNVGLALGNGTTNNTVKRCEFKSNKTGLNINSSNSIIGGENPDDRNVAGLNTQQGISLVLATDVTVQNNMLGTLDGTTASPNTYEGLYVLGTRTRVLHNVCSGNYAEGISISELSTNTLVKENIAGLDSSGQFPLGNSGYGIEVMGTQDSIVNNVVSGNSWGIMVQYQAQQTLIKGNIVGPNKTLDSLRQNNSGGIYLVGTPVSVDSNIISGNNYYGININGYGGAVVRRNMIGTDPTGTLNWGNKGPGVNIVCDNNVIGGPSPSDRNIISGNIWGGIEMFGGTTLVIGGPSQPNYVQGNVIQNNIIGTDISGTVSMSNFTGLFMNGYVDSNVVRDNLISGNRNHGIWTRRSPNAPSRNVFQHNRIGTQADGVTPLPNDSTAFMIDSAAVNLIGGPNEADANIIAFSNQAGIAIKAGWGTKIQRNSIFDNKGMAIDLGNDGPTPNDSADTDQGPNRKQNFPRITWLDQSGGSTTVKGRLQSRPLTTFRLEFFTNDMADSTGFGESKTFQVTTDVTTDSAGNAPFTVVVPGTHGRVVATATDPDYGTSEVSKAPFVVNSTADRSDANPNDGLASTNGPQVNGFSEVTLRSALQASNHVIGEDDITFNIPGAGTQFILPQSPLPIADFDVTIDGSTQPGYVQGAVQNIQVLGTNAGTNAHGLRLAGDHTTVRALYISGFLQNGIDATGNLLTLIDMTTNGNKAIGVESSHSIALEGENIFSGNGPAAPSATGCSGNETGGIRVAEMLRGTGTVVASGNCGPGVYQTAGGFYDGGILLEARVTASNNSAGGIWSNGDITLKGERFEFNANGFPNKRADGIRAGLGDITIDATAFEGGHNILANGNSSNGITCDNGSITLRGRAQVNNNGAGLSAVEAFNRKITGIRAYMIVRTQDVEVMANGLDGIKARESIIIEGNAIASNHPGRGLWGVINVTLDGTEHLIENNRDGAIWAANGYLHVKGTLTVRNNTVGGHHGEDESPDRGDAKIGAVEAYKSVITEGLLFEDNTPTGISSWGTMTIRGNAVVKRSRVRGIHAQGSLLIEGAEHVIVGNGGDGIASHNGTLVVRGNILLEGNGGVEPDEGYGAAGQRIEMDNVTARGNHRSGLLGASGIQIRGQGILMSNMLNGASSSGVVSISGGRICENLGYGVEAPIVRISGTQICNNGLGGVSGKLENAAPAGGRVLWRSRNGMVESRNGMLEYEDGMMEFGKTLTVPALSSGIIRGSSITGNGGNGIFVDSPYPFRIEGSNISGNTGFGVKNAGGGSVSANDNWWGSAEGPGAAVSGSVDASSWQSSSVGLYIGSTADSIYVLPGDTGTFGIVVMNWSQPADSFLVDASDSRGWLTPVSGRQVVTADSVPGVTILDYAIPEGASVGDSAKIVVSGSGQLSPGLTVHDTLYLVVYTPSLHEIILLADTILALSGDTLQLSAAGLDQTGRSASFSAHWTATGGSIDSSGRYVAGLDTGVFIIRLADTLAGLSDSAYVRIVLPAGPGVPGTIALTAASINAGSVTSGQQSFTPLGIMNTSGGILRLDSMKTLTAYFAPVWDPTINLLRVGDTLVIDVAFMPDTTGTFGDTLFVYNSSATSPVKVSLTGNGSVTRVPAGADIPTEFVLHQNYPNPFNPSTTIRYGVPFASHVTLRVYDILGREVARLADGVMKAGFATAVWTGNASSGTYFYRLEAVSLHDAEGRFVQTRRMVLIR